MNQYTKYNIDFVQKLRLIWLKVYFHDMHICEEHKLLLPSNQNTTPRK